MRSFSDNPFQQAPHPLQLTITAPHEFLDVLELLSEDIALAITRPIDSVQPQLIVLIDRGDEAAFAELVASVNAQHTDVQPSIRRTELEAIDWVEKVQKDFPPFRVGPFYVYGSYHDQALPKNAMPLCIDAAAAFGTGEHETTAGCLRAITRHARTHRHVPRILDMGCGTAILAIAAARTFKSAQITACDNDAKAVHVSAHNLRVNQVHPQSLAFVSDGYRYHQVRRRGHYPLIIANILARPLMKMARAAAQHLSPQGTLILSGVMRHQVNMVASAYRKQGLIMRRSDHYGRWSVITFIKH